MPRASRCMNGDRLALSGTNWLAGTLPVITCTVRTASISSSSANVQATKPVNARTETVIVLPIRPLWQALAGSVGGAAHAGKHGGGVAFRGSKERTGQRPPRAEKGPPAAGLAVGVPALHFPKLKAGSKATERAS